MASNEGEAQKNDSNLVMEEIEVVTNEVGVEVQALVDTETKGWNKQKLETEDVMMKNQAQVETTKFEDEKLQARLRVTIQIGWNNKLIKPIDKR